MNALLRGLTSIAAGLADIVSFGAISAERAREHAGLNDPRPDDVKDAEALASDWDAVLADFTTAHSDVHHAIESGTVTADHFHELGEAYGEYVRART